MFDLNEQIEKWRTSLMEKQTLGKSDIDELETHLREEIEQLGAAKLSEEEAFSIAAHRLGDTNALAGEFEKVNTSFIWRNRLFWMASGMLAYLMAKCLAGAVGNGVVLVARMCGLKGYAVGLLGSAAGALSFAVILLLTYIVCKTKRKTLNFGRLASDLRGKITLMTCLIVLLVVIGTAQFLFSALLCRITNAEEVGRIMLISAYLRFAFPILLPVALMAVMIKLRSNDLHTVSR